MNRRNRIGIILWPHASVPTAAADGPRSDSNRCDRQVAIPQKSSFHGFPLPIIGGTVLRMGRVASDIPSSRKKKFISTHRDLS